MDHDWSVTRITRERKDTAWKQLGTSGSGNHFVEFGVLTLPQTTSELGLEAGEYVALLSHSGSRGTGRPSAAPTARSRKSRCRRSYERFRPAGVADLDSEAGQEYWAAMNLMGEYAAANHAVIHRLRREAARRGDHRWRCRESPQLRLEGTARRSRGDRASQRGDAGGRRACWASFPGRWPTRRSSCAVGERGRASTRRRTGQAGGCGAKRRTTCSASRRAEGAGSERGIHVLSAGSDEVPGVYKRHPRGDGGAAGSGRDRRAVRSEDREDVRRWEPGGGLDQ